MKFTTGMAALALAALAGQALAATAPAATTAVTTAATTVLVNFDTVTRNARVGSFYNGGTDSNGGLGLSLGIEFRDFATPASGAISSQPGYVYNATGFGVIDVLAGFNGFDFAYGTVAPTMISVWSDFGGGGTLLGSIIVNGSVSAFAQASVPFAGFAHSVTVTSRRAEAALDDLRFTTAATAATAATAVASVTAVSAVPEASGWAMLALGAFAIGGLQRRRPEQFK